MMTEWCLISSLLDFIRTHPPWHNHGNGLNQALEGDQFVEAVHLAGCHIQPVLRHHTCRREEKRRGDTIVLTP